MREKAVISYQEDCRLSIFGSESTFFGNKVRSLNFAAQWHSYSVLLKADDSLK